jgi:hypothetical protein
MKKSISQICLVIALLFSLNSNSQIIVSPADLTVLIGDWTGSLHYIDYSTNEPYSMPADLNVRKGRNDNQFLLFNSYPLEQNANSKEKIKISKNGTCINKHEVTSKKTLANNQLEIITVHEGKDGKRKALIRYIYVFGENELTIRKEVKFEHSDDWLVRNVYQYIRQPKTGTL